MTRDRDRIEEAAGQRSLQQTEGESAEFTSRRPSKIRGERMTKPVYPVHSYPWYVHDWRQSRARLRLEPLGRYIYRELLDEAYLEGSLSDEPPLLAKICDVPLKDFLRHWSDVSKNFDLRDGVWHHPKVDEVLANIEKWKDQRASAGRASGRSRSTKNERSFNGRSTGVEASSSTSTSTTTTTTTTTPFGELAEQLYRSHPKKQGKVLAEQALAQAVMEGNLTESDIPRIEASHAAWCASRDWTKSEGQYAPTLAAWIQRQGWRDDPPVKEDKW